MERDLQVRHYWVIPVQPFQFTLVLKPCEWLVISLESHLGYVKNVTDYCVEIFIASALYRNFLWASKKDQEPKKKSFFRAQRKNFHKYSQ